MTFDLLDLWALDTSKNQNREKIRLSQTVKLAYQTEMYLPSLRLRLSRNGRLPGTARKNSARNDLDSLVFWFSRHIFRLNSNH